MRKNDKGAFVLHIPDSITACFPKKEITLYMDTMWIGTISGDNQDQIFLKGDAWRWLRTYRWPISVAAAVAPTEQEGAETEEVEVTENLVLNTEDQLSRDEKIFLMKARLKKLTIKDPELDCDCLDPNPKVYHSSVALLFNKREPVVSQGTGPITQVTPC